MSEFNFVMVSAGFEHGGNVTHRHLDGRMRNRWCEDQT